MPLGIVIFTDKVEVYKLPDGLVDIIINAAGLEYSDPLCSFSIYFNIDVGHFEHKTGLGQSLICSVFRKDVICDGGNIMLQNVLIPQCNICNEIYFVYKNFLICPNCNIMVEDAVFILDNHLLKKIDKKHTNYIIYRGNLFYRPISKYEINGGNIYLAAAKEMINKINDRISKQSKI